MAADQDRTDQEDIAELQAEVERLGELIDNLYRQLGISPLDAAAEGVAMPEVDDAIRSGQLIVAIKAWRQRTGAGLKEAKDAVEARARSIGH